MKKFRILFTIGVCLLSVGLAVVIRLAPHTLTERECGEVYRRYAHREGVEAAFVRGFPVNDTVSVDVTLLRAADSAGWECLMKEFNISQELREVAEEMPEFRITEWLALRGHPETKAATMGKKRVPGVTDDDVEVCATDFWEREICIFHTRNAGEVKAIMDYNFYKMEGNKPIINN